MASPHIVVVAHTAWGHIRPLCALVARLVKLRNSELDVTFFTNSSLHAKVAAEVARNFEEGEWKYETRIRVVGLPSNEQNPFDATKLNDAFEVQFRALAYGQPIYCAATETQLPPKKRPDAVLVDIFGIELLRIVRAASPQTKVWASGPGSVSIMYTVLGPFGRDSAGLLQRRVDEHMAATGKDLVQASLEVVASPSDEVVETPGFQPMYKYENFPQQPIMDLPIIGLLHLGASSLIHECDAFVTATMPTYDPPAGINAFDDFFALTGRKMYLLGPLIPDTKRATNVSAQQATNAPQITTFLQGAVERFGEKSLVYIAFGSIFWTTQPDRLWTLLDVLMERKVPFILSHASPFAQIPDEVAQKVKASALGMLTPWAPQQTILEHPATGWFVTHAGFNSVTEAIDAGVPLICWPFGADQPLNTQLLTTELDVAYELTEVRTGPHARKPVHRTGVAPTCTLESVRAETQTVLDKAFGEDGARKRENIRKLRSASRELWGQGGSARLAALELLETLN
ncbi:glycosyltransferase family 1 protein [Phanerochaete sordida]|uniref:Glycosyltransferase family 1 protein n=1 Tax=Phanerochaete sordida TaxID=48140 RepID=A0A9P3GNP0_9APHY|nr:glycosyltransferase family 1 protein [Phanerochaete sordida]